MEFISNFPLIFGVDEVDEVDVVINRGYDSRLVVQNATGAKNIYYPRIKNGSVSSAYPFSVSTSNITLTPHSGDTSEYFSAFRADDIVRLQVNQTYTLGEKTVWVDIFEGRINDISTSFGSDNITSVKCVGHGNTVMQTTIDTDKTYTDKTTGYIISDLLSSFTNRLTDASPTRIDSTNSTSISEYNIKADSKNIGSVIRELEIIELQGYRFSTVPVYASDRTLSEVNPVWEAVDTSGISGAAAIENTIRLMSANFTSSISKMINKVTVYGGGATQFSATAIDATSQTLYGVRSKVFVDKSILSTSMCQTIANSIIARWKDPVINGNVMLRGTPQVSIADYLQCKIPSLEVNGDSIDSDYIVRRTNHNIAPESFTTSVDVGEESVSVGDIISSIVLGVKVSNANGID